MPACIVYKGDIPGAIFQRYNLLMITLYANTAPHSPTTHIRVYPPFINSLSPRLCVCFLYYAN